MSEREKAIFKAVRGDKVHLSDILNTLLTATDQHSVQIAALVAGMQSLSAQQLALDEKVNNGNRPRKAAGRD